MCDGRDVCHSLHQCDQLLYGGLSGWKSTEQGPYRISGIFRDVAGQYPDASGIRNVPGRQRMELVVGVHDHGGGAYE